MNPQMLALVAEARALDAAADERELTVDEGLRVFELGDLFVEAVKAEPTEAKRRALARWLVRRLR
jgi:hypothetical protein